MSTDNTLFVKGVPEGVTQSQLNATITGAAKDVSKVNLNDRKRFAHVVFESHEAAEKGLKALKKTPISGSVLEFEWSKPREAVEFDEASNKTVFIGNLSTSVEVEEVQTAFADYGEIERVFIVTDKKTKASKGQAVVEYKERESAEKALELNETELGGQTITVEFAKAPRSAKGGKRPQQQNGGASKKPGQKRKADDNGSSDNGDDSDDKPAKKQKAATPKKDSPKKEAATPKKETPKKEAPKEAKKETPKKEAPKETKKETPKKAATPKKDAATPSKAKGKK